MTTTPDITTDPVKEHPGRYWLAVANDSDDPIQMAGAALCGLLELLTERDEADQKADSDEALVTELDEELNATRARLEAVRAVVAKSKAEWAGKIREALGETTPAEPAQTVGSIPNPTPSRDDSVGAWRTYAAAHTTEDVSDLNRSQIRTLLGMSNA